MYFRSPSAAPAIIPATTTNNNANANGFIAASISDVHYVTVIVKIAGIARNRNGIARNREELTAGRHWQLLRLERIFAAAICLWCDPIPLRFRAIPAISRV